MGLISDVADFKAAGLISDCADFKASGLISDGADFKPLEISLHLWTKRVYGK